MKKNQEMKVIQLAKSLYMEYHKKSPGYRPQDAFDDALKISGCDDEISEREWAALRERATREIKGIPLCKSPICAMSQTGYK